MRERGEEVKRESNHGKTEKKRKKEKKAEKAGTSSKKRARRWNSYLPLLLPGPEEAGSGSRKTGINKTNTHCIFSCPCPTTPLTRLHTPSNCHVPPTPSLAPPPPPLPLFPSSPPPHPPHPAHNPRAVGEGVLGRTFTPHASGCQGGCFTLPARPCVVPTGCAAFCTCHGAGPVSAFAREARARLGEVKGMHACLCVCERERERERQRERWGVGWGGGRLDSCPLGV